MKNVVKKCGIALIASVCFLGSLYAHQADAAQVTYIKTLKIAKGNSHTLTIKGRKGKISWSSNKKKIAVVNKKGKVTAKASGIAKVTGKIKGKKYITTVKVYNGSKSKVRSLTNPVNNSGGQSTVSGSYQTALKGVGKAIAKRDTKVTVLLNQATSAGSFTTDLMSAAHNYIDDYDYLSLRSYAYSATTSGDETAITYTFSYRISASYEKSFQKTLKKTVSSLHLKGSTKNKVKTIHQYIVNHTDYVNGGYTAYNALIDHGAVCEGYALLFYEMCNAAHIQSRVMTGTAYGSSGSGNHAWNIVKIGGKWYNIDVTWDDTTDSSQYYLKNKSSFPSHYADTRSCGVLNSLTMA